MRQARHHLYLDAVCHVKLWLCPTQHDILSVFSIFRRCRAIFVKSTKTESQCYTFVHQGHTIEGRPQATVTQRAPLLAHLWKDLPAEGPPIEGQIWSLDPKSFPVDWKIHSRFEPPTASIQIQADSLGHVLRKNATCTVLEIFEDAALACVASLAGQLHFAHPICVREIIAPCDLPEIGSLSSLTRPWCRHFAIKRFRQSFPARRGTLRGVQTLPISSLLNICEGSGNWGALFDLSHLSIFVRHPCVNILPDTITNVTQIRRKLCLTRRTKSIPAWRRLPAYSAPAADLSLLHLNFVFASTVSSALSSSDIDEVAQLLATCVFPQDVVHTLLRLGGSGCVFEFGLIGMEPPGEEQQAVMDRITLEMKAVFDRERLAVTAADAAGRS